MSWNIRAAIPQEEHENIIRPMELIRAPRGITTSATISKGDTLDFSGIEMDIIKVTHYHYPPTSVVAPNSVGYCFPRPMLDSEIETLKTHGFKDLG